MGTHIFALLKNKSATPTSLLLIKRSGTPHSLPILGVALRSGAQEWRSKEWRSLTHWIYVVVLKTFLHLKRFCKAIRCRRFQINEETRLQFLDFFSYLTRNFSTLLVNKIWENLSCYFRHCFFQNISLFPYQFRQIVLETLQKSSILLVYLDLLV